MKVMRIASANPLGGQEDSREVSQVFPAAAFTAVSSAKLCFLTSASSELIVFEGTRRFLEMALCLFKATGGAKGCGLKMKRESC